MHIDYLKIFLYLLILYLLYYWPLVCLLICSYPSFYKQYIYIYLISKLLQDVLCHLQISQEKLIIKDYFAILLDLIAHRRESILLYI